MRSLSKRLMALVRSRYEARWGLRPDFLDLAGRPLNGAPGWASLPAVRRKRCAALQQSLHLGEAVTFRLAAGLHAWVVALEDRRMVHGGIAAGPVWVASGDGEPTEAGKAAQRDVLESLARLGLSDAAARRLLARAPVWTDARLREGSGALRAVFYETSGWDPQLMTENRLRGQQQEQLQRALQEQKERGQTALYTFEKERALLAGIRAGDRQEARRILNEMLAVIYLSSPRLAVLRARTIEMLSCLTRAAIEDNPLLEPLIERNHTWTERLVRADSFEALSETLMNALDDFMDAVDLHGVNRTNEKVRRALDFIAARYAEPISLRAVAAEVGLSRSRMAHLVKQFTGRSVHEIIQQVRVRHAQHLLDRTAKSCAAIAYEVGFSDQGYFTRQFKRLMGVTPARYRRGPPPRPS